MKKIITLTICLLGITQFNFSQYYYFPSSTPGNPGGLNTDNEYPNGSGLPAGWTVILGPSNSSPTWSTVENIGFPFNFNGNSVTNTKFLLLVFSLFQLVQVMYLQKQMQHFPTPVFLTIR